MSNINYLLIQKDALKSYIKNASQLVPLGIVLTSIPVLIAYITYATKDLANKNNQYIYLLLTVPLLLIMVLSFFLYYELSLKATDSKLTFGSLKIHLDTFAHFVINQFLVIVMVIISALPAILAGAIFFAALNNRLAPFDKFNLSFGDLRSALGGIYLYFYAFLFFTLINIPFIFYTILRVGFSGFYTIKNDSTAIAAIKENIADTQKVDYVNGFMALLAFAAIDVLILASLVWVCNIIAMGTPKDQIPQLVFILVPIILIPIIGLQFATMYKKISQRDLLVYASNI